jgi:hypothetical protein
MYSAEMEPGHFRAGMIELPGHLLQDLLKGRDYPADRLPCPAGKRAI